jgi:hypothetical protein
MTAPARNILASLPIACVAGISAAQQWTEAEAFAAHCFSPFLTAETAAECLAPGRVDFYDLRPFSGVNPVSPPMGRPVTPGTDRRCEVAFDGEHVESVMEAIVTGLTQEGILSEATVPADFPAQSGTAFIAARYLNRNRIAVVQVGTRPGPYGTETFINVERLVPLSETSQ